MTQRICAVSISCGSFIHHNVGKNMTARDNLFSSLLQLRDAHTAISDEICKHEAILLDMIVDDDKAGIVYNASIVTIIEHVVKAKQLSDNSKCKILITATNVFGNVESYDVNDNNINIHIDNDYILLVNHKLNKHAHIMLGAVECGNFMKSITDNVVLDSHTY